MTAHDGYLYLFLKNMLPSGVEGVLAVYFGFVRTFFHVVLRLLLHAVCIPVPTFLSSLQNTDSGIAV